MNDLGLAHAAVSISEAQAYVRVETGEEEAILAGLVRTASALCESFLNQVLIARPFTVELPPGAAWERIPPAPVRSIGSVEAVDENGTVTPLPTSAYAVDVDSGGDGWVRIINAGTARRIRVSGVCGMAAEPNGIPEPIRQGILRLVAHLFASRDSDGGVPPAAVTALWRPYRRMQIA